MRLYHFTAAHLLKRIKKEGLTMGAIPLSLNPVRIKSGYRWLTTNREFEQSWNTMTMLKYDRAAYRITIDIPEDDRRLMKWTLAGPVIAPEVYDTLSRYGDPDAWYLYEGNIPTRWFGEIVRRR